MRTSRSISKRPFLRVAPLVGCVCFCLNLAADPAFRPGVDDPVKAFSNIDILKRDQQYCYEVTEKTDVKGFIGKCVGRIKDPTCQIFVELPCVNGKTESLEFASIKGTLEQYGFVPVVSSVGPTNGKGRGACTNMRGNGEMRTESTPLLLNPQNLDRNDLPSMTLHWTRTKTPGTDDSDSGPSFHYVASILRVAAYDSPVLNERKNPRLMKAEGRGWGDIGDSYYMNMVKCDIDGTEKSGHPKTFSPGLKGRLLKAQAAYIEHNPEFANKGLQDDLERILEYGQCAKSAPGAGAASSASGATPVSAPAAAAFTPKDPSKNYAGTPCEPFTLPVTPN